MAARNRISSYSVWETVVFVLNVLAFVLMGLQVRPILSRLSEESRLEALVLAAAAGYLPGRSAGRVEIVKALEYE